MGWHMSSVGGRPGRALHYDILINDLATAHAGRPEEKVRQRSCGVDGSISAPWRSNQHLGENTGSATKDDELDVKS